MHTRYAMPCKHTINKHVTWNLQQKKERSGTGSIDPRAPTKSHPSPGGGGVGHPPTLKFCQTHPPPPWGRTDTKQKPGSSPQPSFCLQAWMFQSSSRLPWMTQSWVAPTHVPWSLQYRAHGAVRFLPDRLGFSMAAVPRVCPFVARPSRYLGFFVGGGGWGGRVRLLGTWWFYPS